MHFLRQSTASQSVVIGPFVDSMDGNTPETGLTISNTDIRLSKNGANIVAKNSGGGTHDELGYYTVTLDATDTDTVGRLQLMVHEAGALPVYHEFQVLEEAVHDALTAPSATGTPATTATAAALATVDNIVDAILVDTAEIGTAGAGLTEAGGTGDHLTAINLPDQVMSITGNITGSLSGSVGSVTGNVGGAINGLTAAALADFFDTDSGTTFAGAVGGSVVAEIADNAGGSALTAAAIAHAVWVAGQAGHVGAGSFGEVATEIAAILADTNELHSDDIPGLIAALNDPTAAAIADAVWDETMTAHATADSAAVHVKDILADTADIQPKLGTPSTDVSADIASVKNDTGTTIPAAIAAVQADTNDIQARLPAGLSGGNMPVDVQAISGSAAAADALELSTEAIVVGAAVTGTLTTTSMTTDLTINAASQYNGRIIIFQSDTVTAALRNQATDITSTGVANGELGFTPLTTAPVNGDTFVIV